MRVRGWQDILEKVVESNASPDGWRAVAGDRSTGVGEDMFVGHPDVGVYQLKTYAKNPFEVRGVGGRVARRVDEDLDPLFPEDAGGRFGVRAPVEDEADAKRKANALEEVIRTHAEAPTTPTALFDDVMETLESPAFGPIDYEFDGRPDTLDELTGTFEEAEALLETEFEDIVADDGVDRGFH